MALQHHEFELWLRDAERLRLYVQSGMAEREMQSASLKKVELVCHRLELEAKESAEKAARVEAERDEACHEAAMAKLTTEATVNTRAQIESELARVQRALALAEMPARGRSSSVEPIGRRWPWGGGGGGGGKLAGRRKKRTAGWRMRDSP